VTGSLALRAVALAAVALLGVTGAFAIASRTKSRSTPSLPAAAGGWRSALAAPAAPRKPHKGACGVTIGRSTMGIANPVLPCGVQLYLSYGGTEVLTQVIDRGPATSGTQFLLTRPLARRLHLVGARSILWRFAR
jgi:hypothetical protein